MISTAILLERGTFPENQIFARGRPLPDPTGRTSTHKPAPSGALLFRTGFKSAREPLVHPVAVGLGAGRVAFQPQVQARPLSGMKRRGALAFRVLADRPSAQARSAPPRSLAIGVALWGLATSLAASVAAA